MSKVRMLTTVIQAIMDSPIWYREFTNRTGLTPRFVTSELRNLRNLWLNSPGKRVRLMVSARVSSELIAWNQQLFGCDGYRYSECSTGDGRFVGLLENDYNESYGLMFFEYTTTNPDSVRHRAAMTGEWCFDGSLPKAVGDDPSFTFRGDGNDPESVSRFRDFLQGKLSASMTRETGFGPSPDWPSSPLVRGWNGAG